MAEQTCERDLKVRASRLRLAPTLLSGMSFRWRQREDGIFEGVLGGHAYELRETEDSVLFRVLSADKPGDVDSNQAGDDAESRLRAHLSLERGADVDSWLPRLRHPAPPCFVTAASFLGGVRVLTVDRLEAVVAFMGSANNNIKRNMQMVEALCAHFGEATRIELRPGSERPAAFYRFPSVAQLLELSVEDLWALGWGYRAPRLHRLARELAERGSERFLDSLAELPEAEARAALCQLSGIGRKVADCVLLFAYGHDGCVPVDTHCLQLAQTRLLPAIRGLSLTPAVYQRIVARFHELFGPELAGWAFMILFVAELSDFKKMIACRKLLQQELLQQEQAALLPEPQRQQVGAGPDDAGPGSPRERTAGRATAASAAAGLAKRPRAELEGSTPDSSARHSRLALRSQRLREPSEATPSSAAVTEALAAPDKAACATVAKRRLRLV